MAYALSRFSSFFMNDIIHLDETKERWQKEAREIRALNLRITIACRQDGVCPRFLLKVPDEPLRYRLAEDRKALVGEEGFTVPVQDGDAITGSPTWLYYQQYLLMEATKKWGTQLNAFITQLTKLDAHFTGFYWASSPLLATVLTTGYEDTVRVPLPQFWHATKPILSSYVRQFIDCAIPKKEKKEDQQERTEHGHEDGHEEAHEEDDHEEERESRRVELLRQFIARCKAELGNIELQETPDGRVALYQMSNLEDTVSVRYGTVKHAGGEIHPAAAAKTRKSPGPTAVEQQSALDPSRTTRRQTAAFFDKL
jgi:hypothetical protein